MAKRKKDEYIDIFSNDPRLERKIRRRRKRARRTKGQRIVRALSITAIIACLGVVGYLFAANKNWFGERLDSRLGTDTALKEKSASFLICGVDFEEGTSRAHLTDVQLYVNFDIQKKKISILQIPRDTYVTRAESNSGKINAIYGRAKTDTQENGIKGLAQYINKAYRLPVDHYATINMTTFKKLIDDLGGVPMYVPTTITLEGVTVPKGKQTLSGIQAEKFVRFRKGRGTYYDGSDLSRIKMQRLFMAALAKKLKSTSTTQLISVITPMMTSQKITTDLTLNEVKAYMEAMRGVEMKEIVVEMVPGEACYYGNQSVYTIHKQEFCDLLNEKFRPYGRKYTVDELNVVELKNTTQYYTNTIDDFDNLLSSDYIPGKKKETSSASSGG